jgi:hypothetical protein
LRDAVDSELAHAKIDANAIADKIDINLRTLREMAAGYAFLFVDTTQLVMKANDDLVMLIKSRISGHQAAEAKRLEAERERIRQEEVAKLERQQAKERLQLETGAAAQKPAPPLPAQAISQVPPAPLRPVATSITGITRLRGQIAEALADMLPDELNQVIEAINAIRAQRKATA